MQIPVLCGDVWHPADIVSKGLAGLDSHDFDFDLMDDAGRWSAELMERHPVVVLSKANNTSSVNRAEWMDEEAEAAFSRYVRCGGGLLAIHSGTAGYENCSILRSLLGGVFSSHPDQCPVTVEPEPGHPLTAGANSFTEMDEHYFMALDDPDAEVFVTTRSVNGSQPGGWRRTEEGGRVAVITPGHNLEVWLQPSFQALLRNCLRWCGGLS